MNSTQRKRLQDSLSHLIGLELWLIGELELDEQELLHHFSSLQSRMAVVQAIAWHSDEDGLDDAALAEVAVSKGESPYG